MEANCCYYYIIIMGGKGRFVNIRKINVIDYSWVVGTFLPFPSIIKLLLLQTRDTEWVCFLSTPPGSFLKNRIHPFVESVHK